MEDAAILLIVGGLLMLGLVVSLVLLRALFPAGRPSRGDRMAGRLDRGLVPTPTAPSAQSAGPRRLVPIAHERDEGRKVGRKVKPHFIDDILTYAESQRMGTLRILRLLEGRTLVRYYDCDDCRVRAEGHHSTRECSVQAGFLEGAFGRLHDRPVEVREIACRRAGDPGCDFEVFA